MSKKKKKKMMREIEEPKPNATSDFVILPGEDVPPDLALLYPGGFVLPDDTLNKGK